MTIPAVVAMACCALTLSSTVSATQPNFLFILADDLGIGNVPSIIANPNENAQKIQTPNLLQLSKESIRLTEAYSLQVCAPTRTALMLGRNIGNTTIRGNDGAYTPLLPSDVTVAEVLKSAGYETALIGKWGLGNLTTTGMPTNQGFDTFFGYDSQVACHDWYPSELGNQSVFVQEPANQNQCGAFSENLFVDRTVAYLKAKGQAKAANPDANQPFFAFLGFVTPHSGFCDHPNASIPGGPYAVPYIEPQYKDLNWTQDFKDYASVITRQDRDIGTVLDALDSAGLKDDTVLIYMSDNGPEQTVLTFFNSSLNYRGYKRSLFEGGSRTLFFARWPGHIPAGTTSDALFYPPDFMATLADMASIDPTHLPAGMDGESLAPVLLGKEKTRSRNKAMYWEFCHKAELAGLPGGWQQAVRRQDGMKGIRVNRGKMLLFNLTADVSETTDVSASFPDIVKEIETFMEEEHVEDPHWPSGPNCCNSCFTPKGCGADCPAATL